MWRIRAFTTPMIQIAYHIRYEICETSFALAIGARVTHSHVYHTNDPNVISYQIWNTRNEFCPCYRRSRDALASRMFTTPAIQMSYHNRYEIRETSFELAIGARVLHSRVYHTHEPNVIPHQIWNTRNEFCHCYRRSRDALACLPHPGSKCHITSDMK